MRFRHALLLAATLMTPIALTPAYAEPFWPFYSPAALTYGDWAARYWENILSLPANGNPINGNCEGGVLGGDNQPANSTGLHVWFLPHTFDVNPITRSCNIPANKWLFFPLMTGIAYGVEPLPQLRLRISNVLDTITSLTCVVDGVDCIATFAAMADLKTFRASSPAFSINQANRKTALIPPGFTAAPADGQLIVTDGYWIFLFPLPVGPHVVRFGGRTTTGAGYDITYNINVLP
jgi:hypothetical protein